MEHPILNLHMSDGTINQDGNDYFGLASDGEEIFIGNVGHEDQVEKYLQKHPNPTDW